MFNDASQSGPSYNTLIIEDFKGDLDLVMEYISSGGISGDITSCSTLKEAKKKLKEQNFDLVLLDLGLPDSTGLNTLIQLKITDATIPIIVLTGQNDDELGESILKNGAQDYLVKGSINSEILKKTFRYAIARQSSDNELEALFNETPTILIMIDEDSNVVQMNKLARVFFPGIESFKSRRIGDLIKCINAGEDTEGCGYSDQCHNCELRKVIMHTLQTGDSIRQQPFYPTSGKNNNQHFLLSTARVSAGNEIKILLALQDVSEIDKLRDQLNQSQKMESIGRLTGGIAHDFNNMLSIIIGYSDLSLQMTASEDPIQPNLDSILDAAQKSAKLTKQLLAFSRQQPIEPKPLNLNQVITDMGRMLTRLIGEEIDFRQELSEDLWDAYLDQTQVDQILANLAVNARDAIEGNGRITVSTMNHIQSLDDLIHRDLKKGEYVCLSFSDNGSGIPPEQINQIFEPFFTTKPKDKGTGLGLSTIYGIVKQNDGVILVDSRVGEGTNFALYFPRNESERIELGPRKQSESQKKPYETVLIVEDELPMMRLTQKALKREGYHVLTANKPGEALLICEQTPDPIHLLLTDVILPQMDGNMLRKRIEELKPQIKTLYMSGYTADIIGNKGILPEGEAFLQKPFTLENLKKKVRIVLDK